MTTRPSHESHAHLQNGRGVNGYATANGPRDPTVRRHRHHWWYIWIPLFTAFIWFSTLLAMLITWLAQGRQFYVSESPGQKVAYISDVGADILKPLFIVGCSITAVGFFLTLCVERWLRHSGRLHPNMRRRERVCSSIAMFGSFIGGAALILLSVFDTKRHMTLHRVFLFFFVLGVAVSAIFTVLEFRWIEKSYPDATHLRRAYMLKGFLAVVLIAAAIAFGVTLGRKQNVAAIIEWCISFGFTFYLLTFYADLRASRNVSAGELTREKLIAGGNVSPDRVPHGLAAPRAAV
ncbi:hypothetical protein EXIGLDRAFT_662984 [Exidia glandulosa HHB12029]|uniref:CWH43-like N-terminal domain-containing protein n=1 Tax=Exidia glandulosa HHB12029 TaxID=1314781 RepID=A0A165QK09_EXIGL|nr:hypothetical protein EXIGLDRAFT_662984 [Exidia glandulosa HHB12029]